VSFLAVVGVVVVLALVVFLVMQRKKAGSAH
jgi:hypothetical protein